MLHVHLNSTNDNKNSSSNDKDDIETYLEQFHQNPNNSIYVKHNDMSYQSTAYYEEISNPPLISEKHETKDGIPYEIEGGDVNFISARCIDVDKKTWERYKKASLGRKESSLYSAFLQQVPSMLKRDNNNNNNERTRVKKHKSIFGLPMISPRSRFYFLWYILITFLDVTYTAFAVPIIVSFIWNMDHNMIKKASFVDITIGLIFFIDFILNFHIGFVIVYEYKKKIIMKGKHVACFYLRYGGAWIDMLSLIPLIHELVFGLLGPSIDPSFSITVLRVFRLIRLSRLIRVFFSISMIRHSSNRIIKKIPPNIIYLFSVLYIMLVMVNFLGCILYFIATLESVDLNGTWIEHYDDEVAKNGKIVELYILSVYWAITTVTTVGFGDIVPTTTTERIAMMVIMVTYIMLFGLLVGSMSQLVKSSTKEARNASAFKNKMSEINRWSKFRNLPSDQIKKLQAYYNEIWMRSKEFDENALLDELPMSLKRDIIYNATKKLMENISIFKHIDIATRQLIAGRLSPINILPGHELVRQGDLADSLFILEEGALIIVHNEIETGRIDAPSTCGESSLLSLAFNEKKKHSVTLRAYKACYLWKLDLNDIEILIATHPHIKHELIESYSTSFAYEYDAIENKFFRNGDNTSPFSFRQGSVHQKSRLWNKTSLKINGKLLENQNTSSEVNYNHEKQKNMLMNLEYRNYEQNVIDVIYAIKSQIAHTKGIHGIIQLFRKLRKKSNNNMLDLSMIQNLLKKFGATTTSLSDLIHILVEVEHDGAGLFNIDKLILMIRNSMIFPEVDEYIKNIFSQIDINKKGYVDSMMLIKICNIEYHNDVQMGLHNRLHILKEIIEYLNIEEEKIYYSEFQLYHKDMSLSFDNFDAFKSMTDKIWNVL